MVLTACRHVRSRNTAMTGKSANLVILHAPMDVQVQEHLLEKADVKACEMGVIKRDDTYIVSAAWFWCALKDSATFLQFF